MIEVTDVKVKPTNTNGMKALCSIVLNDMIAISDIRIVTNKDNKLILAMPSKRTSDGKFRDICNPTNKQARKLIEQTILSEYKKALTLDSDVLELVM